MNNIIVVSGPSGSGKSTLLKRVLKEHREIAFSVSFTTRQKGSQEVEAKDYYYVSKETFQKMILEDEFAEWAEVYGNLYGTTLKEIETKSKDNEFLALDIDVQGAKRIKEKFSKALLIMVTPPSLNELRSRIKKRCNRSDDNLEERLQVAKQELLQYQLYDYIIKNEKIEEAYEALKSIYIAHRNSVSINEGVIKEIIGG
jgi:guanylate kinase